MNFPAYRTGAQLFLNGTASQNHPGNIEDLSSAIKMKMSPAENQEPLTGSRHLN